MIFNLNVNLGILVIELLGLYWVTKKATTTVYTLFFLLTRSQKVSLVLLSFLTLPGTIIHEFSHLLLAEVLRVQTGTLSFTPRIVPMNNGKTQLVAGSVSIGKSDPIRRYLIGFAPVFGGLSMLVIIILVFSHIIPPSDIWWIIMLKTISFGYLMFTVSSTMFSSRKDLEGFLIFLPVLLILAGGLYWLGVRIELTGIVYEYTQLITNKLVYILGIVIGIDTLLLLSSLVLKRVFEKVSNTKMA